MYISGLKKLIAVSFIAFLAFVYAFAMSAYADDAHHSQTAAPQSYTGRGEVVAVDQAAGRVKMKHEAIPALGWPSMTMFFQVADKSQLDGIHTGSRVEFVFIRKDGGAPLITGIKPIR